MLDLVRLSSRRLFPPGGEDLYRQIALLTELGPGREVLDVASGKGIPLEYFVREYGVHGTGVESDPKLVAEAEAHAREEGLGSDLSFQEASPGDLPFRDETFDVAVGELGLAASSDPAVAVGELARVVRPGGHVILVQLVWKAPVEESRRQILADHLGARPLMMVELRRLLKDARVGKLHIEDWTDEKTAFRPAVRKPFPDFAELFSLGEKLEILRRAWRKWGWRGVRTVFRREVEVHRLLTRERLLGLSLVRGIKAPAPGAENQEGANAAETPDEPGPEQTREANSPEVFSREQSHEEDEKTEDGKGREPGNLQTAGLPLFGPDDQNEPS